MLSGIECQKCEGNMTLQYDTHGTYFSCMMCGSERATKCPHCDTNSIIVRPWHSGPEIVCKACGCSNGELGLRICMKNREPGLVMV